MPPTGMAAPGESSDGAENASAVKHQLAEVDRLKLKFEDWYCDKEPSGLVSFMASMSSVITSLRHGDEVEDYLDRKADRKVFRPMMVSSIITDDPDFQLPLDTIGDPIFPKDMDPRTVKRTLFSPRTPTSGTVRSMQSLRSAANTTSVMKSAGSYYDLSEGARTLDRMLYSVLRQLVKGSKAVILDSVSFPSYIQGICLLVKHCEINRNNRIQKAFQGVDTIELKDDAMSWATTSMVRIKELLDSRAGITHYILKSLMGSLDGKSKTVQAKIAEDMAALDPDDEVNIYDLLQTYATQLSSIGFSGGGNKVLAIEDDECHNCHGKGHHARNCPHKATEDTSPKDPKEEAKKAAKKAAKKERFKLRCGFCGKKGHIEDECFKKKEMAKAMTINEATQSTNNTQAHDQQSALAAYLTQLKNGTAPVQRMVTVADKIPQLSRDPVGRDGERIGEASHPGPTTSNMGMQASKFSIVKCLLVAVACAISVCDGMGCGLVSLRANNVVSLDRYLAVEISEDARRIAKNANPFIEGKLNIDHSWHTNLYNMTETGIEALGHNAVKLFLAGPPCQDFSKLRLIVKKSAQKSERELRPGLNGPNGRKFREIIKLWKLVKKHNPDCEFLIECVDFRDLEEDWAEVCEALGDPMLIDAKLYSYMPRFRAYWSNFVRGRDLPPPIPELDPNVCMLDGRSVIKHMSYGKMSTHQIGGSWRGNPDKPYAATARPVLVNDPAHEKPQQLQVEEAEQLHGHEKGSTAGRDVTNKMRLEAIGRGWDINVTNMLLSFSSVCGPQHTANQYILAANATDAIVSMYNTMEPEALSECLMELDHNTRDWYMSLLTAHIASTQECEHQSADSTQAEALAGSQPAGPNVERNQTQCDSEPQACPNSARDGENELMDSDGLQQAAVVAILEAQEAMEPGELAAHLMGMDADIRDWYLQILASYCESDGVNSSVLDSGSARHLQSEVCVTDNDTVTPLSGFDGSIKWTEGNGYVPAQMTDSITGASFKLDVDDVDLMTTSLVSNIWSMGKLIKNGWKFHLDGEDNHAITPGGAHRVDVELSVDNILRISHQMRVAKERVPLPSPQVATVKQSARDATSHFLHDCFFHRSDEKIFQTLGVTKGYKQARISTGHCDSCAKAKARSFGLSQKRHEILANMPVNDPVFDDDNDLDPCDSESEDEEFEYVAPVAGRELGEQSVPRFDLEKLRPFEAVFVDNKDYPCQVRGGAKAVLLFIDYKTRTKHKVDIKSKAQNGEAFQKIVSIEGIHKLPYHCRVYTDGCGSMHHVKDRAVQLGMDHQFIPPRQQSLNEAEKVCDSTFAEVRTVMEHHNVPSRWFSLMLDFAMHTDLRTATTASRKWKTPYEMTRGITPFIGKLHRPCTRCFVQVPREKRKQLAAQGLHNVTAEPGRLVGFHGPYSSTYAVMLDTPHEGSNDRLVHSRNVSFNDDDYIMPRAQRQQQRYGSTVIDAAAATAGSEEASEEICGSNAESEPAGSAEPTEHRPVPNRDEHFDEYFDTKDPKNHPWFTHAGSPAQRPRPSYNKMCSVMKEQAMACLVTEALDIEECMKILFTAVPRHEVNTRLTQVLAAHSQTDMDWNKALSGPDRDKVITALENEMESLQATILTEMHPDDAEYNRALELATPGRLLLGIKRSGMFKARGVKQGFKEDIEQADGPDFNYYAHVAKFNSIRMSTFRPNRGTRRIAVKDVSTAFLQADKYPDGTVKYMTLKDPLTKQWRLFKQDGPVYGEKSAQIRWENTIAPWYESVGFERGKNEPSAFYDEDADTLALLYTDDNFFDAEEQDVLKINHKLEDRFDCKDIEWLEQDSELDYLGLQLFQTRTFTGFCLEKYILKTLNILGVADQTKTCPTPISQPIDNSTAPLTGQKLKLFPTAVGCFGWMANTCRPDISYAHSRLSQHLAKPTESAWDAMIRCCNYLRGTADMCIAAPMYQSDRDLFDSDLTPDKHYGWEFYSDSDFAGNSEEQNKRRSQNGFIATLNGAPVLWGSKVSSVAFAHPDIGEAHADISSGAAEVYAAGNATFEFLHLSYTADEMGIDFPKPIMMQVDNKAAIAFSDNTAFKTKLKHIDVRQEWVQTLRNKSIVETKYVNTKENLADLFTKILDEATFTKLRDRIMYRKSEL